MSFFAVPSKWRIPDTALRQSFREMAIDGARGCEGVAMWLGNYEDDVAVVTHVAILRGRGVQKAPDLLQISPALINDLADIAIAHKLTLIGQIHSHGTLYGTNLSLTDRRYGIAVPGFLSAVAPDYAMRPETTINECGVHVFEPPTGWRRLSTEEINVRMTVLRGVDAPVLVVGQEQEHG